MVSQQPPTDNVADERRRRLTPTEQSLWWLHARAAGRAAAALSDGWYKPIVSNHQSRAVLVSRNAWFENETLEPEGDGDEQTARCHKSMNGSTLNVDPCIQFRSSTGLKLPHEQQVRSIEKNVY